jgi:hypothetical protein
MPDSLIGGAFRVKCTVVDGAPVPVDPDALAAHRQEVAERHPELVRPAKTEQERNHLTAQLIRRPVADAPTYRSNGHVAQRPRERRAKRSSGSSSRDGPSDEPDPPLGGRTCEVCGGPLADRRGQTRTCSNRCRQKKYRRHSQNGNGNGHRVLTSRERSILVDRIARARLEQDGGFQKVERQERDLERARQRLREAAA